MSVTQVCPKKLAAFDKKAAEAVAKVDYIELLNLRNLQPKQRDLCLREYRIRGIEYVTTELQKVISTEEAAGLTRLLQQCPRLDTLTNHLLSYKEAKKIFAVYSQQLQTLS